MLIDHWNKKESLQYVWQSLLFCTFTPSVVHTNACNCKTCPKDSWPEKDPANLYLKFVSLL